MINTILLIILFFCLNEITLEVGEPAGNFLSICIIKYQKLDVKAISDRGCPLGGDDATFARFQPLFAYVKRLFRPFVILIDSNNGRCHL